MSADTRPIAAGQFAAALKDLSVGMLHLKVLEIRNSIAHLQYSNDQLRPFAEGISTPVTTSTDPASATTPAASGPDQDCVEAIAENEQVIERMAERIALVRAEVEERGLSWTEFESTAPGPDEAKHDGEDAGAAHREPLQQPVMNGETAGEGTRLSAWTDGTFQTGTIRNGQVHMDSVPGQSSFESSRPGGQSGGSLSDEQLRRAMEERPRGLGPDEDDDAEQGMHL